MADYTCQIRRAGPGNGSETPIPVVYVKLTDTGGAFSETWFYVANGLQNQILAVALAAINGQRTVDVEATPPNPNNSPYTSITHMYLEA